MRLAATVAVLYAATMTTGFFYLRDAIRLKRPRDPNKYDSVGSIAVHFLPNPSAAAPVVLLPAKGSSTSILGLVRSFIKNSASEGGMRAGCG